jgi:hypothetical protein
MLHTARKPFEEAAPSRGLLGANGKSNEINTYHAVRAEEVPAQPGPSRSPRHELFSIALRLRAHHS